MTVSVCVHVVCVIYVTAGTVEYQLDKCAFLLFAVECSLVEEEVIAAHGIVEEYIAFDNM